MPLPRAASAALLHTAFYRFTPLPQPQQVAHALRERCREPDVAGLGGSVLVAPEGINGVLAGPVAAVQRIEQALQQDTAFGSAFAGMTFRRSACSTVPFGRLKIQLRQELVQMGVAGVDARATGINVSPQDWRALIQAPDVVLLDNRNSFEYRLGHFQGAIDPQVENFRDFADYVRAHAAQWKREGKRVAMYCTGGIRCEKTSAWMRSLELPVLQLEGGILGYFQHMPDAARDFHGECFVFDNRIALDTRLQETATTLEQVYGSAPADAWRLQRARRLAQAAGA